MSNSENGARGSENQTNGDTDERAIQRTQLDTIPPPDGSTGISMVEGSNPSQDWKSQLDSIPTPGSSGRAAPGIGGGAVTPSTSANTGAVEDWRSQLDSIPTPGSAHKPQNPTQSPAASIEPDWKSQLDNIPTPGAGGNIGGNSGASIEPDWKSQLDNIPTPGAGSSGVGTSSGVDSGISDNADWRSQLDAIGAPSSGVPAMNQNQYQQTRSTNSGNSDNPSEIDWKSQLDAIPTPKTVSEPGTANLSTGPASAGTDSSRQWSGSNLERGPRPTAEFSRNLDSAKGPGSGPESSPIATIIAVIIILVIGAGIFYVMNQNAKYKVESPSEQTQTQPSGNPAETGLPSETAPGGAPGETSTTESPAT